MYKIVEYDDFVQWLASIKDKRTRKRIETAVSHTAYGHFGDHKQLKGYRGLYEIRLDFGPGYRLYYFIHGQTIIFFLHGGDKSTQIRDIIKAWRTKETIERTL